MSGTQTIGATTKLNQHEIIPSPNDVGALANRINKETKVLHDRVNKMVTVKLAIAYRDYKVYRQGLQCFYHVFAAIEKSLNEQFEKNGEWTEMLKEIWKPEVARKEKCEQDLMFYYNDDRSKFETPMMTEQINFSEHILQVTREKPYLLLAYLHVMYLALFAGGRIMRSSVAKTTGLFPHKDNLSHEEIVKMGANFYTFDVPDESMLRLTYKRDYELVTRNGLTEAQKLEVIDEAKYIFSQNIACVSELERHNMVKLAKKWAVLNGTYYTFLVISAVAVLYFVRRIILHLL